jgi:spore coat polysaccharide biosynthesis protein SpsF
MTAAPDIGIVLQARMRSTRLPRKILMPLGSRSLLDHILFRLGRLRHSALTVVATSDAPEDEAVAQFCAARAVACFRGSEHNVLDRYYRCALRYHFRHIVRLTGDNPFLDIEELDNLIDLHLAQGSDFAHSFPQLPVGCGAEIFTFAALEKSWREGAAPHHLEHVDEYMLEHPEIFATALLSVSGSKHRPEVRLTIDTPEDYRRACYIVEKSGSDYVSVPQAIELAEEQRCGIAKG